MKLAIILALFFINVNLSIENRLDGDSDPKNAILILNTTISDSLLFSVRNAQCIKCSFVDRAIFNKTQSFRLIINTEYPSYFFTIRNLVNNEKYCSNYETTSMLFGEGGEYVLEIQNATNTTEFECSIKISTQPSNRYTPIVGAVFIYIGVAALYIAGKTVYSKIVKCKDEQVDEDQLINNDEEASINQPQVKKTNHRLESVDTFRGLCLCIMIFVNYGAGDYAFLDHAVWNGLHLADLVFPCFMFIMGVSLALSMNAITAKARTLDGKSRLDVKDLLFKIIKRTILLFFFGLLISNDSGVSLSNLRIFGVLQRFAISYVVCALIEILHLHFNGYVYERQESFEQISWKSKFKELLLYPIQWVIIAIFTLVWLLITFLLPVPGCPTGYLGPGGLHENSTHYNCTGGAAGYIDRTVLGAAHVYPSPTCRAIYNTLVPHDPEGILGCLTSCVLTYLGVSAGHIFIHYKEPSKRVSRFIVYGVLYGLEALILCKWSRDDGWIPINKNLWSLSFILALASIAFIMLALSYLVIDVWNFYTGVPFIFPGKNSICIYICHIVFANFFPVRFNTPVTHAARLSMDLYGVTLWCIVAANLYYKKIFINL